MVNGMGWNYSLAIGHRHVLHSGTKLGGLSRGYVVIRGKHRVARRYWVSLTLLQAWFMDVLNSTYGGGIWCAVMMMGLNVSPTVYARESG